MMRISVWRILRISLLVTSLANIGASAGTIGCSTPGWFGESCKHKCRCDGHQAHPCNQITGECFRSRACQMGWFGPSCQYRVADSDLPPWATDNDAATCNDGPDQDLSITAQLLTPQTLTWLLLGSHIADALDGITVQYVMAGDAGNRRRCLVQRETPKANVIALYVTREVFCPVRDWVSAVILSGAGVLHLCSVHISMGRNVATKQTAFLDNAVGSPNLWPATSAVDGIFHPDADTNSASNNVCSNNSTFTRKSTLFLLFDVPMELSAMFLHFRVRDGKGDCCEDPVGLCLTFYDDRMQQLLEYAVRDRVTPYYSVVPTYSIPGPVRMVTVESCGQSSAVSLCEVEAYGDCGHGFYGLNCEYHCNCNNGNRCSPTGRCPAECPPGLSGKSCNNSCSTNTYGPGCKMRCSPFCEENLCHAETGKCLRDCRHHFQPPNCLLTAKTTDERVARETVQELEAPVQSLAMSVYIIAVCTLGIVFIALVVSAFFLSDIRLNSIADQESANRLNILFRDHAEFKTPWLSPTRSESWGSNICDAGDDVQSISTPSELGYLDLPYGTLPDEWNYDMFSFRESAV